MAGQGRTNRSRYIGDLTRAEVRLLQMVSDGLPYKAIMVELGICKKTLYAHSFNLKQKLEADSMAHAVKLGMRRKLIQ